MRIAPGPHGASISPPRKIARPPPSAPHRRASAAPTTKPRSDAALATSLSSGSHAQEAPRSAPRGGEASPAHPFPRLQESHRVPRVVEFGRGGEAGNATLDDDGVEARRGRGSRGGHGGARYHRDETCRGPRRRARDRSVTSNAGETRAANRLGARPISAGGRLLLSARKVHASIRGRFSRHATYPRARAGMGVRSGPLRRRRRRLRSSTRASRSAPTRRGLHVPRGHLRSRARAPLSWRTCSTCSGPSGSSSPRRSRRVWT